MSLKVNCNTLYTDLVAMINDCQSKFPKLIAQDPVDYPKFIATKRHVAETVAIVISQLAGRHNEVRKAAQGFIVETHALHQFIVSMVIGGEINADRLEEMKQKLQRVHMTAKELMKMMSQYPEQL